MFKLLVDVYVHMREILQLSFGHPSMLSAVEILMLFEKVFFRSIILERSRKHGKSRKWDCDYLERFQLLIFWTGASKLLLNWYQTMPTCWRLWYLRCLLRSRHGNWLTLLARYSDRKSWYWNEWKVRYCGSNKNFNEGISSIISSSWICHQEQRWICSNSMICPRMN